MRSIGRYLALLVLLLPLVPPTARLARAQTPLDAPAPFPRPPLSLGQPPRIGLRVGPLAGYDFEQGHAASRLFVDVSKPLIGPKLGGFQGEIEGSVGTLGATSFGSVGANVGLPWCVAGAEYSGRTKDVHLMLSLRFPWRRGGLLGLGDLIRVDYHGGEDEILAGISFRSPFTHYHANRPRHTDVRLPASTASLRAPPSPDRELDATIEKHLAVVAHSITWMERLLTPRFDPDHFEKSAARYRDHIRQPGHTYRDEDAAYHRSLDAAFTTALGGDSLSGRAVAALAESVLFRDVVVPFDRMLGEEKSPRHAGGLCALALPAFDRTLAALLPTLAVPSAARSAAPTRCREILRRVLVAVQAASSEAGDRWRNGYLFWCNRGALAWLPLNYGLRPEQYDTQPKWNAVLAAVSGEPFTEANTFEYLMMEQFHPSLKRMIRETRDYQVTVVHDFRGINSSGSGDMYGWDLVVDGYIPAFVRAIREMDDGERDRLPQFFLFLDENYYEENGSRDIVSYLESLYRPSLPGLKPREFREQIDAAHDSLLAAIRNSTALKRFGEGRLRDLIKVHVNVTNRFDPAFLLDVTHRDHRKMAFRDVSEADPAAGILLVTGQGIGEHYNGSGWEDRSLSLRGTALVEAKTAARNLFLQQGFKQDEVPDCLRPMPFPSDYPALCARLRERGWTTPASVLVNETGYGTKEASVLKTAIYNLAPPGSVLLTYDSLWTSEFWAGMLVGAALRGGHEFPIGPTPPNAPSSATTTLYFLRQTLHMLFEAQRYFAAELSEAGGQLRVGLYAHNVQTNDFRRRVEALQRGLAKQRFLRDQFPLNPSIERAIDEFHAQFQDVPFVDLQLRPHPFLHLKSQLFGTAEAFRILELPVMGDLVRSHLAIRQRQSQGVGRGTLSPDVFRGFIRAFEAHLDSLSPGGGDRVILTFTTGSQNQDPRSMRLDGEVLVAVSGYDCAVTLIDFMFVLFITEWPATSEEFDRNFPPCQPPFYMRPLLRSLKDQS